MINKVSNNIFIYQECQNKQLVMTGDVQELSLFAWSTVHGFATLAVDSQLKSKELGGDVMQYADKVTNLIYSGLRI